jgi:actin-related protein
MSDELTRGEITIVLETGSWSAKVGYADSWSGPSFIHTADNHSGDTWPIVQEPGDNVAMVPDWDQLGEFWKGLIQKQAGMNRRQLSDSPLLLNVPWGMHHRVHAEKIAQICFEVLQVPALYLASQPVMSLYACGAVNGIVIDLGHSNTTLIPILDSNIQNAYVRRLPVGGNDCKPNSDSWTDIFLNESHVNIAHHLYDTVRLMDNDKQSILLDHLFITGGMSSRLPKFRNHLETAMNDKFIAISDFCADGQPKSFKFLRIPDYLTEMKGKEEHASWFGGSIVAKLVFPGGDGKGFLSRTDYNEHGPKIAWEKPF